MENIETSLIDWEELAAFIDMGQCVLFLGPGATVNYKDKDRQNNFFLELQKSTPSIHSYQREDGLFVFSKPEAILGVQLKLKKFYDGDFSSDMLGKIAEIPFHFIVMLTPDTALEKEMTKSGFAFNADYYNTSEEHKPDLPTIETPPLIYHLLGVASQTSSLIVSHKNMYQYIKSLLGGIKVPQNIKTAMNSQNANSLIFLGMNFDKWYFQLILNMLAVDENNYTRLASIQDGETALQTVWKEHFHINFVPHHIDEFVDKLHGAFASRDGLRKAAPGRQKKKTYKLSNIRSYIEEAFSDDELQSFCFDNYSYVYKNFTLGQEKSQRITKLLEYVGQQDDYDKLLSLIQGISPNQYKNNAPYYDEQ